MTSTYSISFTYYDYNAKRVLIFNGIFTVNGSGTIVSFYSNENLQENILTSICSSVNKYIANPYNFQANIMVQISQGDISFLKLSSNKTIGDTYTEVNIDCLTSEAKPTQFIIAPYVPPNRFSLKQICCSIYSDNARVFYKSHSLPSCGVGTVKNSRHVAKKT